MITYFTVSDKTIFIPFRYLYPECAILIKDNPQLHTLFCLTRQCPKNAGCMEILAKRVHYIFTELEPLASLMISYFKVGESLKGGIFTKDLSEPRVSTLNQYGFNKMKTLGVIKNWVPSSEFLNINNHYITPAIIPATSLIRHS